MVSASTIAVQVILLGALYSLIAIGFTLIFGVGGVLNLAHGASITIGAYGAFYASQAGASVWVAAAVALIAPAVFSYALYRGMIRRVPDNPVIVLILTLVVALIVEQVFLALEGSQPLSIPTLIEGQTALLGLTVGNNRIAAVVLSFLVIGALIAFINRTRHGKAILALSMSHKGATVVGIEPERVYGYIWLAAGLLAGLAGLFLGSFQTANPLMGRTPLLLAFAIVVVGGLGSVRGSLVGAYVIALLDQVTINLISTRLAGVAALVVLVIVLLVRPEGLFGRELVE